MVFLSEVPLCSTPWKVHARVRAKREQLQTFSRLLPESQGQTLASTVLYVPYRSHCSGSTALYRADASWNTSELSGGVRPPTSRQRASFQRVNLHEIVPSYERAGHLSRERLQTACYLSAQRRYRGTSLMKKRPPLGPYRRAMPRALWWSYGGGVLSDERGTPVHTICPEAPVP